MSTAPTDDGDVVEDVQRPPADVVGLADRLGGELRRGDVEESVGARRLQRHDLRIDGRVGDLVADLGDDHLRRLVARARPSAP